MFGAEPKQETRANDKGAGLPLEGIRKPFILPLFPSMKQCSETWGSKFLKFMVAEPVYFFGRDGVTSIKLHHHSVVIAFFNVKVGCTACSCNSNLLEIIRKKRKNFCINKTLRKVFVIESKVEVYFYTRLPI